MAKVRGNPVHGGQEPEAAPHGYQRLELLVTDGAQVLGDRVPVMGELLPRRRERQDAYIGRRDAEARALPVEGDDRGAGFTGAEPQVPGDEIAVDERPGQVAADCLDGVPSGLDELACRDDRLQYAFVVGTKCRVVEIVQDRPAGRLEVLEVEIRIVLGQVPEVELGGCTVQCSEPPRRQVPMLRERASIVAGILDEQPGRIVALLADEAEIPQFGNR